MPPPPAQNLGLRKGRGAHLGNGLRYLGAGLQPAVAALKRAFPNKAALDQGGSVMQCML
jgi:hypothetical protein